MLGSDNVDESGSEEEECHLWKNRPCSGDGRRPLTTVFTQSASELQLDQELGVGGRLVVTINSGRLLLSENP